MLSFRNKMIQGLLILITPIVALGTVQQTPPKIHGRLSKIGSIPVLRVWGTPRQMGFAHGYLRGQGVVDYLTETFAALPSKQRAGLDQQWHGLVKVIHIPDDTLDEIKGILEGIIAANDEPPMIEPLDRPLGLDDLIIFNAMDMTGAIGCSGYTVWGQQAGDAGVITTRNFDFQQLGHKTLQSQMILVRRPKGKRQVATVTLPGYLGAVTGINDKGVCAFIHGGSGGSSHNLNAHPVPLGLVLKTLLEEAGPGNVGDRATSLLKGISPYPVSYLVRIVTPRVSKQERPARVFHIDPDGFGENAAGEAFCITTNHYVNKGLVADPQANDSSLERYRRLDKRITKTVTTGEAWASLQAVAEKGSFPTIHSVVVYPELRELDIALARWKNGKIIPAPMRKPHRIKFGRLFKSHKSRQAGRASTSHKKAS